MTTNAIEPIRAFASRLVALPVENVDTDQIIPARFLKVTDKAGLGEALFADWRYGPDGTPDPDFVLNRPKARGAWVLVAGDNFGCGSSREHAPWALVGYGFRAVISTFFADIFRNNALKNGLLPVTLTFEDRDRLEAALALDPSAEVTVDLDAQALTLPDGEVIDFDIDPFSREMLLSGTDELGWLLARTAAMDAWESSHRAPVRTVS